MSDGTINNRGSIGQAHRDPSVANPPQVSERFQTADPVRRSVLAAFLAAPLMMRVGSARAAAEPRIATLDYALAQTLIVLGAPPVAIADARDWRKWVAEPPLPEATVDLGAGLDPNMELLATLAPDLILTTDYVGMTEGRLERIAPVHRITLYSDGGSPLPKALAAVAEIGALAGREAEARRYLDETERFFDACAERARPFRDRPVGVLSFIDPRHVRVSSRPGLYQDVLDRLGLRNAWEETGSYWGFSTVGMERLVALGDAFVVADYLPPDVATTLPRSPIWRGLPFVGADGLVPEMPTVLVFGGVPSARRFAALILDALEGAAA